MDVTAPAPSAPSRCRRCRDRSRCGTRRTSRPARGRIAEAPVARSANLACQQPRHGLAHRGGSGAMPASASALRSAPCPTPGDSTAASGSCRLPRSSGRRVASVPTASRDDRPARRGSAARSRCRSSAGRSRRRRRSRRSARASSRAFANGESRIGPSSHSNFLYSQSMPRKKLVQLSHFFVRGHGERFAGGSPRNNSRMPLSAGTCVTGLCA